MSFSPLARPRQMETELTAPCLVTTTDHLWIPMPDGIRLAARLWMPERAGARPVPAIFEYIPYRKADMVRARDERNHPWLAARGYACLRVDMRGSGDSEGLMPDMYHPDELGDARHVIDWIAAQPWCSGKVGMFGTSWGGTASLQANIDAPGPLKAIIAVCATHDRYEDDIHHMGGSVLTDTVEWGATLPAILAAPPTPNIGPDWQDMWQRRLEAQTFPMEAWLREEARGSYWRHGSVIHQPERLSRPVLAIGGWSDRYSNSVMSLVSARPDLVWGVVGPWGHHYPDQGHPGPAMGFQQLALEWWDAWLKPDRPQAPDWPRLRTWLRGFDRPADALDVRQGEWIETGFVEEQTAPLQLDFHEQALKTGGSGVGNWSVPFDLRVGTAAGDTGYFGRSGGLPLEQGEDNARSLCLETEPLKSDVILFGKAGIELALPAGVEGQVAVRLNDIAPDGTAARVSYGLRNLALDDLLDRASDLLDAGPRQVAIPLHSTAYRFGAGHRIQVALSRSYWPLVWPAATTEALEVTGGRLVLPVMATAPRPLAAPLPAPLDLPERKSNSVICTPALERFRRSEMGGKLHVGWHQPYTELRYAETETCFGYETRADHRIDPADPLSATSCVMHEATYTRPDGVARLRCEVGLRTDGSGWRVDGHLTACWNDERLSDRTWNLTIPREAG